MKKYINCAFIYSILALIGGVFYREFTKFQGFAEKTTLSVVHTHYFILGVLFFMILALLEKSIEFTDPKATRAVMLYQVGLNLTVVMFVVRGISQAMQASLSTGADAAISGIAGIGHLLLGIGLILTLLQIKKAVH